MRIIKIDQALINLSAVEQYSGSIDDIIIQKLRARLENKCDKGAFVLKVLEIIRRSRCEQTQSRLDGSADVSVLYKEKRVAQHINSRAQESPNRRVATER